MKSVRLVWIIALLLGTATCWAQSQSTLPLGLRFGMTKAQVRTQLVAIDAFFMGETSPTEIAYVVPDEMTKTKNGIFLQFSKSGLVEIASAKSNMDKALYEQYLKSLREQSSKWVSQGVVRIQEDVGNALFMYQDDISFISISGLSPAPVGTATGTVTLTFTERKHYEALHPVLRSK
jgi:hypothetical protein